MAADLGDSDAQMDLAFCYCSGSGVKKNKKMAASYYRIAALQGKTEFGLSWIYKEKYDEFFSKTFPAYAQLEKNIQIQQESEKPTREEKNAISYLKYLQTVFLSVTKNPEGEGK